MADGGGADYARVYRAVAAGESDEEVRRVIDDVSQGDGQRRQAAANWPVSNETPLQAAHRQRRGDLVGALVEAGASVGGIFEGRLTPLAVCIAYGRVDSARALLRNGHDPSETIKWMPPYGFTQDYLKFCSPAHFCLAPAPLDPSQPRGARQVGCLEILVNEGGVDVDARDWCGRTPVFWLAKHYRAASSGSPSITALTTPPTPRTRRPQPTCFWRRGGALFLGAFQRQRSLAADGGGVFHQRSLCPLLDRGCGRARERAQPARRADRAALLRRDRNNGLAARGGRGHRSAGRPRGHATILVRV
jgi:hypothetical protein